MLLWRNFMSIVLRDIREKFSITKEDMAKKLKITRQTYYKYESGESELTLDIVKKIANTFSVDYNDIIENRIPQNIEYNIVEGKKNNKKEVAKDIRIDIPQENIEKFKQIFLYIINKIMPFGFLRLNDFKHSTIVSFLELVMKYK